MSDESVGPAPGEDIVRWVYSSTSPEQLAARYDFWAANYELDTERDYGRNDPQMTLPLVQKYVPPGARILDAGVGTGLVGQLMAEAGYDDLTGIDISAAMMAEARQKGVYRDLKRMVLGETLEFETDSFDAVTCVPSRAPPMAPARIDPTLDPERDLDAKHRSSEHWRRTARRCSVLSAIYKTRYNVRNQMKAFEEGLADGETAASVAGGTSEGPAKGERMYVRTQGFGSTDEDLRFLQRCGVKHKAGRFPFHPGRGWDLDDLLREREIHEAFGLTLDMSAIPIYEQLPNIIYYGKSPERDREIDIVCEMIRTASRAGIDSLRYNTCILNIDRTEREEGRGGFIHTAFRLDKIPAEEQAKLTDAGRVTAEMHWERIEYLLERMIPVAAECKVRLGNSQEDPPTPPGYRGVDKVLNDFDGMKRFIEIQRSPYHGWNFCVGSIAEMLEDSATEVFPFIEYFGSRETIFLVHYRNLMGKRYSFREALPDEGDMDFHRVLKALKDVGYCYGIDPDHIPRSDDDPKGTHQGYAYCFGYINAMIQAVYG